MPRAAYELLVGGADVVSCVLSAPLLRRWYNGWGSSETERAEALPGDALVPAPKLGYTRALNIAAPPAEVWRWLVQFGQGRAGFYSYDTLENLVGCQIHSADQILPEHQGLACGDRIRADPDGYMSWQVVDMRAPEYLVLMATDPRTHAIPSVPDAIPARGFAASTWQWVLRPVPSGGTRLIVRQRLTFSPSQHVLWHLVEPFNFAMERRMLRGLAERAEGSKLGKG